MPDMTRQAGERRALARWDTEGGAGAHEAEPLPEPVIELAKCLGVNQASNAKLVTLTQSGDMRIGQGKRRTRFHARQTIDIAKTAFAWRAAAGPFGAISVCDAYRAGALEVHLFGLIRLAHMDGPALAKDEIMRYLAELAWAPDAIILNRSLHWSAMDERTFWVAAGSGAGRGAVRLDLDDNDRIGSIFAPDRPYTDGKLIDERPWSGRFSNYPLHAGRWIPFAAEVGWAVDGQVSNYWRGSLLGWEVA